MFYQNWKLSIFAMIMIPLASVAAKALEKKVKFLQKQWKDLKNCNLSDGDVQDHKLTKIFQNEKYEKIKSEKRINDVMEKSIKIGTVFVRASQLWRH